MGVRKLTAVAPRPIYQAPEILRSEPYKRWVRSFCCLVCKKWWGIEASHTGPHGGSQKASDSTCIPLCRDHHREMHRGVLRFIERYRLDIPREVERLNTEWRGRREFA
jgi:hypothetical protein